MRVLRISTVVLTDLIRPITRVLPEDPLFLLEELSSIDARGSLIN